MGGTRVPEYTTFQCIVRKWSTIRIGSRIYSVPSRLILADTSIDAVTTADVMAVLLPSAA